MDVLRQVLVVTPSHFVAAKPGANCRAAAGTKRATRWTMEGILQHSAQSPVFASSSGAGGVQNIRRILLLQRLA